MNICVDGIDAADNTSMQVIQNVCYSLVFSSADTPVNQYISLLQTMLVIDGLTVPRNELKSISS